MKKHELDPEDLEVGDVVQWENKYHAAAVVEITEDLSDDEFIKYEVEVLEPIFGYDDDAKGEQFTVGRTRDDSWSHYFQWKFKKPGAMTEYCNAAKLEEHRERMLEIKEEYRDD